MSRLKFWEVDFGSSEFRKISITLRFLTVVYCSESFFFWWKFENSPPWDAALSPINCGLHGGSQSHHMIYHWCLRPVLPCIYPKVHCRTGGTKAHLMLPHFIVSNIDWLLGVFQAARITVKNFKSVNHLKKKKWK